MQLLFSDFPPVHNHGKGFSEVFYDCLNKADYLKVAVGYVSAESLVELKKYVEINKAPHIDICIGMFKFDEVSENQLFCAKQLNNYLQEEASGGVYISDIFPYHGKIFCFYKSDKLFAGIIGSSNLSNISKNHLLYETDILIHNEQTLESLNKFLEDFTQNACRRLAEIPESDFKISKGNQLFENNRFVKKIDANELSQYFSEKTTTRFEIPLKTKERSNLNCFFGKGRENKATGRVKIRHWYEVEIIVPKSTTQKDNYPQSGDEFIVVTDDGWSFECKVSGDYSKNFRSKDDLTVLGRWIKGRMENAGVLIIGNPVDSKVLALFNKSNLCLTMTTIPKTWTLEFI